VRCYSSYCQRAAAVHRSSLLTGNPPTLPTLRDFIRQAGHGGFARVARRAKREISGAARSSLDRRPWKSASSSASASASAWKFRLDFRRAAVYWVAAGGLMYALHEEPIPGQAWPSIDPDARHVTRGRVADGGGGDCRRCDGGCTERLHVTHILPTFGGRVRARKGSLHAPLLERNRG